MSDAPGSRRREQAAALMRGEIAIGELAGRARRVYRRAQMLMHHSEGRAVRFETEIIADKSPTERDVQTAQRLLAAYHVGRERAAASAAGRDDLWTLINQMQTTYSSLLEARDPEALAAYLVNVCRHDAAHGIVQGNQEYAAITGGRAYRRFLGRQYKDIVVSLAEAVGCLPLENPEQGDFATNIHQDPGRLMTAVSERLGVDVTPPDVDGGLLKLRTSRGLFGDRDLNSIYTAYLVAGLVRDAEAPRVCEIGAGSGRTAYWTRRLLPHGAQTIVDLPLVNVVQGFYLISALPDECIVLDGERAPDGVTPAIRILPDHAFDELRDDRFDLVLNQDSMPEMGAAIATEYLGWIRHAADIFLSINHESSPRFGDGRRQISVPELVAEIGGLELISRQLYWLRRGYAVEIYRAGARQPG
jgi:hypothetical protein